MATVSRHRSPHGTGAAVEPLRVSLPRSVGQSENGDWLRGPFGPEVPVPIFGIFP